MSFLGDLLYPGNSERRSDVNQLQTDVVNANAKLITSVNRYNRIFGVVKKIALSNAYLQSLTLSLQIKRQKIPAAVQVAIDNYSDPAIVKILDILLAFGISAGSVPYFVQSAWAYRKTCSPSSLRTSAEAVARGDASEIQIELATFARGIDKAGLESLLAELPGLPELSADIGTAYETLGVAGDETSFGSASDVAIASQDDATALVDSPAASSAFSDVADNLGADVATTSAAATELELSSALQASAGVLVVAVGVDLIVDAISGDRERSQLEDSLEKLKAAKKKLDDSQTAITALEASVATLQTSSSASFQRIYNAYVALNDSLATASATLKKPIPVVTDFTDLGQISFCQDYLVANFSDYLSYVTEFKNLLTSETFTRSDYEHSEAAADDKVNLLASTHNVTAGEIRALMKWFYSDYLSAPQSSSLGKASLFKTVSESTSAMEAGGAAIEQKGP